MSVSRVRPSAAEVKSSPLPKKRDREDRTIHDEQLLYTREQVMRMLGGISYPTVCRLETAGRLRPIKLNPSGKLARVYYRRADVMALAEATADA
jgi:hypothetical protein